MSENIKPNNPFVHPIEENTLTGYGGITLRDYFAAKAISKPEIKLTPMTFYDSVKLFLRNFGFQNTVTSQRNFDIKRDPEFCYLLADAMLKQRELNDENK